MVELRTRKREMRGDGTNHHEKLGLRKTSCASQFTILHMAGTSADPACNYTDTRSSKPNQASHTPDFSYPLPSSTLFLFSFPITLFLVHNFTIITEHKAKSSLSISPCHDQELTPSTAYTAYSIHRVKHTLSTASTQDCLSSFHSHHYEMTSECSFSFRCASIHDQPPSASSPWELKGKVTLSQHFNSCEWTNWWNTVSAPAAPSIDRLQVLVQSRLVMPSKCISKLARSWPWISHYHGLQVHLQTRSITASKCISKLAQWQTPSVSPNLLEYGLQVCTITTSQCISKLSRWQPPSVSPHSLAHHFRTHLKLLSGTICMQSRYTVFRWVAIYLHRYIDT